MNNNAGIETSSVSLQASFTYSVDGGSVAFTDQSRGLNLKTWLWDFGDGSTSASRSPVHAFSEVGNYTVRLTVIDSAGRTSACTKIVWVSSTDAPPLQLWVIIPIILMMVSFVGALFVGHPAGRVAMVVMFLGSLIWFASSGILGVAAMVAEVLL